MTSSARSRGIQTRSTISATATVNPAITPAPSHTIKKALSLDPKHRGANEYLGQAFVELGNLKAAVERLDALEKICGVDCEEYKSLKISIDAAMAGKAKQG